MASRWTPPPPPSDPSDDQSSTSTDSSSWEAPPPLDESCIKYVLSVMVLFMRQTASNVPLMVPTRSADTSFRHFNDILSTKMAAQSKFIPPPPFPLSEASLRNRASASSVSSVKMSIKSMSHVAAVNAEYEQTHTSLVNSSLAVNSLIAKFVGRIIFHISASNWKAVFDRLSTKIIFIATHPELDPDTADLQLMSHSMLDRSRLVLLLNRA